GRGRHVQGGDRSNVLSKGIRSRAVGEEHEQRKSTQKASTSQRGDHAGTAVAEPEVTRHERAVPATTPLENVRDRPGQVQGACSSRPALGTHLNSRTGAKLILPGDALK